MARGLIQPVNPYLYRRDHSMGLACEQMHVPASQGPDDQTTPPLNRDGISACSASDISKLPSCEVLDLPAKYCSCFFRLLTACRCTCY